MPLNFQIHLKRQPNLCFLNKYSMKAFRELILIYNLYLYLSMFLIVLRQCVLTSRNQSIRSNEARCEGSSHTEQGKVGANEQTTITITITTTTVNFISNKT